MSIPSWLTLFTATLLNTVALQAQGVGLVTGTVTDAGNGHPVAGATVMLHGTRYTTLTDAAGLYRLVNIPAGDYQINAKRVGHALSQRTITVRANDSTVVSFALVVAAVRLDEVVTTGSGSRRRLEVGNSIATINADSIVQTTPIRNLSDLLNGRVPGVEVLSTSGAVGSGSRIRIRGVSSLTGNGEPVLIIDGIRADVAYSTPVTGAAVSDVHMSPFVSGRQAAGVNQVSGRSATSRLDDIDPQTIETIEVLRGPSASTLYGSDAANGVIVVTTKRGKAGPARWTFFGQEGMSHLDATFPDAWRGWGTFPGQLNLTDCSLASAGIGLCTQDSTTHFNPLNRHETSLFGTGHASSYGATVSGGSNQLQYFFGGDYTSAVGVERIPDYDKTALLELRNGASLPDWIQRPNTQDAWHLNNTISAQLNPKANVVVSSSFLHQYHRDDVKNNFVQNALLSAGYRDSIGQGWGSAGPSTLDQFLVRSSDVIDRGTGGVTGNWRPTSYWTLVGTAGADYTNRTDEALEPSDIAPSDGVDRLSAALQTMMKTWVRTFDLRTNVDVPLSPNVRARTAVGDQYVRTDNNGIWASGRGLADGYDEVTDAAERDARQFQSGAAVNGWYVEQSLALNERAYLTAALRGDASSAFGSSAKNVYYPKWSASWLVSQEPFFPHIAALNNLRLRAAFGHAGVQPASDDRFRSYVGQPGFVDGNSVPGIVVSTVGNPSLRPERSAELEGGFDLSLWSDRATVELTSYRKMTRDALAAITLPPSFGISLREENLGTIDNRGLEIQATVQPIVTSFVTWSAQVGVARNRNRLVSLNNTTLPPTTENDLWSGQNRYVAGYPLNGFWERPILGYTDLNGDGRITRDEVRLGDSVAYRGQPFPKSDWTLNNNLSLFSGWVSVAGTVNFTYGLTQFNDAVFAQCSANRCQQSQDPNTSLRDQAYAAAISGSLSNGSAWGFLETGSFGRLSELSVTCNLPNQFVRRLRASGANVSLMGRNLALWSSYGGADPEVNSRLLGNQLLDDGGVPQPREWSLRVNLRY